MTALRIGLLSLVVVFALQLHAALAEQRIIGGTAVDIIKHPYLVSIRYRQSPASAYLHQCAGVIYTERAVITAAQCIRALEWEQLVMILAGATTRTAGDGMLYKASHWLAHENYNPTTVDNDIGLIMIEQTFDFKQPLIAPISIRAARPAVGRVAIVAGWGYREEYGPAAYGLEEVAVPIVSATDCMTIYGAGELTERMICAGNLLNGGIDACQGDTGGPLVIDGQLVGLVSWGRGCARPGYPTVYTWVISLKTWIDKHISENLQI